jgi:hypothetical protein
VSPPNTAKKPVVYVPPPDDIADVRAGFEELERGEGIPISLAELDRMAETGEWPDSLK